MDTSKDTTQQDLISNSDRILLELEINHLKELMTEHFASRDKAVEVAVSTMKSRLDTMNEFREQLRDQAARFIDRVSYESLHDLLSKNIEKISLDLSKNTIMLESIDKDITINRSQIEKQSDDLKNLQNQIKDQIALYLTRDMYTTAHGDLVKNIERISLDLSKYILLLESYDKTANVVRAQLEKRVDILDNVYNTLKDQSASFILRNEHTSVYNSIDADIKRITADQTQMINRSMLEIFEKRIKFLEEKIANWEGRFYVVGIGFFILNALITWYISSGHLTSTLAH